MEILLEIAEKMNNLLESDQLDYASLEEICLTIKDQTRVRFRLMDFEFFNEEKVAVITAKKLRLIQEQNFEGAANMRDIEKKYLKHINFKKSFEIEKSMFFSEDDLLVYFHTGTAKNDNAIYSRLTSPGIGFFKCPSAEQNND